MTRNELIDGYAEWLERFKWSLFGTLLFRIPDTSQARANRLFHRWISEMKAEDGTEHFHWFRVTEYGAFRNHLHYHVLIGGLRDCDRWPWLVRWDQLAGNAELSYYHQHGGASRYMLKTLRPGHDFEIEFDLSRKL